MNERAACIYTQLKGVEFDETGRLKGGLWMTDDLMPIRLDPLIHDLEQKLKKEEQERLAAEEEQRRLDAAKIPPEVLFRNLLFDPNTVKELTPEVW